MPVERVGDIELSYERAGSGPPLLLIMGMSGTALHWGEPFLSDLRRDFDVIVYDHRGVGESSPLGDEGLTIVQLASDAAGLLHALALDSAHVVGISMGGMIAQELALAHPELIRTLTLGCTYCGGHGSSLTSSEVTQRLAEGMMSGDRKLALRAAWETNVSRSFAEDADAYAAFLGIGARRSVAVPVIMAQVQAIAAHDTSSRLSELEMPTLVIHGTDDEILPVENGRLIASLIPGSRLEILDGVGHLFFWEQPEHSATLIRSTPPSLPEARAAARVPPQATDRPEYVSEQAIPFCVRSTGTALSGEQVGTGTPIVLLHGLTATRRYVVMGSRLLERSGHRVVSYDARGHGRSAPAAEREQYGYAHLTDDLEAVLDALEIERAVLAGASMGAHTAVRFALGRPERVLALGLITPSFDPDLSTDAKRAMLAGWDALAQGLRTSGVEGFVDAYDLHALPDAWRKTVEKVLRQRLSAHEHPGAVADALEAVPRSRPFESMSELARIDVPVVVVASRDEADPSHPLSVAERYAEAIPSAGMAVEDAGPPPRSPIAWQGGQLSKVLIELDARSRALHT